MCRQLLLDREGVIVCQRWVATADAINESSFNINSRE